MNYSFTFTLKPEQYVEFLRWQALQAKAYQGLRMIINVSFITLLICTVVFFNLYQSWIWMFVIIALGVSWWLFGAPYLFHLLLNYRINERTLKMIGITGFQVTTISFNTEGIHYQLKEMHLISYSDINKIIPLRDIFIIIGRQHDTILLPYHAFQSDEELHDFLRDFELQCNV